MAHLIPLRTFHSKGGALTVIEEDIPFQVRRLFYIYDSGGTKRGEHRHRETIQAAVCIRGSCVIDTDDGTDIESWAMDAPDKCLILEPQDWHAMHTFSADAVLLVMASTLFDPADYIFEPYR